MPTVHYAAALMVPHGLTLPVGQTMHTGPPSNAVVVGVVTARQAFVCALPVTLVERASVELVPTIVLVEVSACHRKR